jgi:hypothetical protein
MEKTSIPGYFLVFSYGVKVKIEKKKETCNALMMLNPSNNFFLEFVEYKNKLKIRATAFLPHIKSVRVKLDRGKLKIRMSNDRDPLYLICKSQAKLERLEKCFNEMITHVKKFPYAIYNHNNLMYYALYELKIYKNKDKIFSERDVQFIFNTIKIRKRKLKSKTKDIKVIHLENKGGLSRQSSNSWDDERYNIKYCDYIKKKLIKLFKEKSSIDGKIIRDIFDILIKKNELYVLFKGYLTGKSFMKNGNTTDDLVDTMMNETMEDILVDDEERITFENFMRFIQEIQVETIDGELIEQLNEFFNQIRMKNVFDFADEKEIVSINFEEFCSYIFSHINSIFDPDKQKIHHDLNHQWTDYFINTSHNTYLVGHQLYGKSTIEGIERAVEQGCRCIEIDCWDGKDFPVVTHGHTLTKQTSFEEMIQKLSKIAFKNNRFPLILSLETHCAFTQREKMAYFLKQHFGKRLLVLNEETVLKNFKLSQLMKTVILKTESNYPSSFNISSEPNPKLHNFDEDSLSYITGLFKENINKETLASPFGIISTSESKFFNLMSSPEEASRIRKISEQNLIRIYPDGKRVGSSNYNPTDCWFNGAQMVAMNIQSRDDFAMINKIKYLENGGASGGFILKPKYLLNDALPKIAEYTIEVISGQIIDKNLLDENDFLEIYVIGPKKEHSNQKYILNFSSNFIHPAITKTFSSPIKFLILYPEMSFFVFKIRNSSESMKMIGIVPVVCCRLGIRVLELHDKDFFMNRYSYLLLRLTKR